MLSHIYLKYVFVFLTNLFQGQLIAALGKRADILLAFAQSVFLNM